MTRLGAVALALGLLATTRAAGAQPTGISASSTLPRQDARVAACMASLPADSLVRTVLYLEADVADSSARPMLPVGDLLADLVAQRVRAALGAAPGALPAADSAVAWSEVTWLSVTLHRDGRFTWRPWRDADASADDDGVDDAAAAGSTEPRGTARLLADALSALVADEHRMFWPDDVPGDSARLELHLHEATIAGDGSVRPPALRLATPVFTLRAPRVTPAAPLRAPRIAYPISSQRSGVVGSVVLRFVVAADGTVEPGSIRDVWPAERPRLTGELGAHYRAFLRAAERGVRDATYVPARVGSCAVRQLVQQTFAYDMR